MRGEGRLLQGGMRLDCRALIRVPSQTPYLRISRDGWGDLPAENNIRP